MRYVLALLVALPACTSGLEARATLSSKSQVSEVVAVPGGTVELLCRGYGPTIVMLPSGGRGGGDFEDVAAKLAVRGYRVLLPQPHGAGLSSPPTDDITLAAMADDVAAAVRKKGGGQVVLVGHAFGGFVARMVSSRHPDLVRGLVFGAHMSSRQIRDLTNAGPQSANSKTSKLLELVEDRSVSREDRLAALRQLFFASDGDPVPWLDGWYPAVRKAGGRAIATLPADSSWTIGGTAPVLDILGAEDPLRPAATARYEVEALGAGRVTSVVIPNARHALFPEKPDEVTATIVGWEKALPTGSRAGC